uniref:beta-N-acetylhexosaminidase n=1 Tax=uncultured bacterium FLS12 TaxID=651659 RepID=C5HLB1_9BACT|nr:glycoside hydrolase family protein [uncultured bacterium FLS12]
MLSRTFAILALTLAATAETADAAWPLLPVPREMAVSGEVDAVRMGRVAYRVDGKKAVLPKNLTEAYADALSLLVLPTPQRDLASLSAKTFRYPKTDLFLDPDVVPHAEGYTISISRRVITVRAHDEAGLFRASQTLKQIGRLARTRGHLPCIDITDWPDFPNRGAMLDVTRTKVPEMESLYALVDKLAEWKYNQIQLYFQHAFAYRGHHPIWENASPMTPVQIRALDAYCRDRYIELVPNQECFGHMQNWLWHPDYNHLAEIAGAKSPADLCPTDPASIEFLDGLYADLLPNFTSRQFNVGCDEVGTLGLGRSKAVVEEKGQGRVYLDFLLQIYERVKKRGFRMQFWADIVLQHPELIPELPKDVIALEWGYGEHHPFDERCRLLAQSGISFYVAPGTSSWSLIGMHDNAVANLKSAAENGLKHGAIGYLVTDWGDSGHWQFRSVSYPGLTYGAAVSWCYETNVDVDIPRALDAHVFEDAAGVMGQLVYDMGLAYRQNGVSLFRPLLRKPDASFSVIPPHLRPAASKESLLKTIAYMDDVMARLPETRMACPDADQTVEEWKLAAALARLACRLGIARDEHDGAPTSALPADIRRELATELEPLIPAYRQLWLARNRSGGLKQSAGYFEHLLALLDAD